MRTRTLLALALITTLTLTSLTSRTKASVPSDRLEIYRNNFNLTRGKDFQSLLKRAGAENIDTTIARLNDNNAQFIDALTAAAREEVKQVQNEIVAERRRAIEEATDAINTNRRQYNHVNFKRRAQDGPVVTVNRSDDGVSSKAGTEKTFQDGDTTITQGQSGDSKIVAKEGGLISVTVTATEYVDAVNQKERTSLRTETTTTWETTVPSCPEASGVLTGRGKIVYVVSKKITTPQTIAILKEDFTTDLALTGTVNDLAELPSFDMKGRTTKTLTGFNRARGLGLLDDSEKVDGTISVNVSVLGNKFGGEDSGEMSDHLEVTGTDKELGNVAVSGAGLVWLNASDAFQVARRNWRGGGCVEVKLAAPKVKLRPGERVEVTAETVHKYDKSKVAALLTNTATDSATPNQTRATTQAVFTLTAPRKGSRGMIIVDTVSRRGTGSEMMRFEEDIPGQKPGKCGGWVGQVSAVTNFHRDVPTKLEGRLVSATVYKEWNIAAKFQVTGVLDPIGALDNGYFADGNVTYTETDFRRLGYAKGSMSCKGQGIIQTEDNRTYENVTKADGGLRTTVYVSQGVIEFSTADVPGKRTYKTTYDSQCTLYNATNSNFTEEPGDHPAGAYSYRIEFPIDRRKPNELKGSVTVQNEDGSETSYTWDLTRCKY